MPIPSMNELFMQLGLESDDTAIDHFVKTHQLPDDVKLCDAPFWTTSQRQFLLEQFKADAAWIVTVDQLNEQLHEEASAQAAGSL